MRYDDASQAGSMAADTAPVARADVDALPPGSFGPATGNTISGAGTITGTAGADSVGDAPARIVEVEGAGGAAAAAGNSFQASGQYGVLNMDAQGNFNYVRNSGTPDGVQDVFRYTLADADGTTSSTTLTIDIGAVASAAAAAIPGVVNLPPGVELSDIRVSGRDLIITMPDGTQMVIPGGAVFVPQLVIGDVQVPASNLAALLIESEPQPAAGQLQSSGGNFAVDVPPLDPGVPLGDLIPPTELSFPEPVFEEVFDAIDDEPEIVIIPDGQPAAVNAVDTVDEAGLPTRGSEPEGSGEEAAAGADGDPSEATSGVISISAEDGIDSVTINGVEITTAGQVITGEQGTLTITSVNLATGQIGYTYLLTDNTNPGGDNISDFFQVTVTDDDGDTATATLTIDIIDDVPTARDDTDALAVDATSTDGNVMTGVGTTSGSAGHDTVGADNATVTGVHPGSGSTSFTAVTGAGVTVSGTFGDLLIHSDGSYTYTLHGDVGEGGTEVFTYQITDGDGDPDTATLTITVPASPNEPPVVRGSSVNVSEEGLPGSNPDTAGTPDTTNSATASGSVFVSDPDGDPLTVTLGIPSGTFTSGGTTILWTLSNGGHTLTGTAGSDTVITITIDNAGGYDVTLSGPVDHPANAGEQGLGITVPVNVSDGEASTPTSISVTIEDDSPVVAPEVVATATVVLDETATTSTAPTIDTGIYAKGDDPDVSGSGVISTDTSGGAIVDANVAFGGDGPAATDSLTYSLSITNATSGLSTTDGSPINLVMQGGVIVGVVNGGPFNGQAAFAISINSNTGVVTVEQYLSLDHPVNPDPNDPLGLGDNTIAVTVTATDADQDSVTSDAVDISNNITFLDDGPSVSATVNANAAVTLDESGPGAAATISLGANTAGNDEDVTGSGPIARGTSGSAVLNVSALFGADGPGTSSYVITVANSASGVTTTEGEAITLVQLNATTILGIVAAGGEHANQVAFAIQIDPSSGVVTVEQYLSLDHPVNPDPNDPLQLANGAITASVTVTDGDGDPATSAPVDISDQITFLDDGPSVTATVNAQAEVTLDESGPGAAATISLGANTAGDDEDVTGSGPIGRGTSGVAVLNVSPLFGADGAGTSSFGLSVLNASSGVTTTEGEAITLVQLNPTTILGIVAAGGEHANQVAFAIQIDPSTGVVTVEQYLSLDHPVNPDPNDPLELANGTIGATVTVTDGDGDPATSDAVDISDQITFLDDGPTARATVNAEATVTLDESGPGAAATISLGANTAGNDEDVTGAGPISRGTSGSSVLNITALLGADGQGTGSYGLSVMNSASGVTTTEGEAITLVQLNATTILGIVAAGGEHAGQVAFAMQINSSTGVVTVEQYLSLDHPVNPDPNDPLQLADGTVGATVTVTDGDGDPSTSAPVDISDNITFLDDGPSANATLNANATVTVDESGPAAAATISLGANTAGNDEDVTGSGPISRGVSGSAVLNVSPLFGADGPGTSSYTISVANSASGVTTTEGEAITLVQLNPTTILGIVTAGGEHANQVAFAIQINSGTGAVTVEQYLSLDHPVNPDPNDPLQLANGAITATVSVTDGDGDPATSAPVDISDQITFLDDGPTAGATLNANATVTLDESGPGAAATISLGVNTAGNDEDVTGSGPISRGVTGSSVINTTGLFGADGPGTSTIGLSVINANSGVTTTEGEAITLVQLNPTTILGIVAAGGEHANQVAFAIQINSSTGVVTVEQYLSLDHPVNPDPNDPLQLGNGTIGATISVTDGDGDPATSTAVDISDQITFLDDGPSAIQPAHVDVEQGGTVSGQLDLAGPGGDLAGVGDNYGADGPGTVRFPISIDGTNSGLTSGSQPIIYDRIDDHTLQGKVGNTVIFTITLNPATSQYTVDLDGVIDSLTEINFNDGSYDFVGGNDAWAGFVPNGQLEGDTPLNDDSQDLLLTPIGTGTAVNGNANSAGVTGGIAGQNIGSGEGMRLDFVEDLTGDPTPGDYNVVAEQNHDFDAHYLVNGASLTFEQGTSTLTTASFKAILVSPLVIDDNGDDGTPDLVDGTGALVSVNQMVISYDGENQVVNFDPLNLTQTVTVGNPGGLADRTYTVTFVQDGGSGEWYATVRGIYDDQVKIATFADEQYNALEMLHLGPSSSDADFAISGFGVVSQSTDPVDFQVPVEIVDGDGDPVGPANLDITVYAVGDLPEALSAFSADSSLADSSVESLSLFASNDNVDQQQRAFNIGQNTALMGALAAAGLSAEPLAASTLDGSAGDIEPDFIVTTMDGGSADAGGNNADRGSKLDGNLSDGGKQSADEPQDSRHSRGDSARNDNGDSAAEAQTHEPTALLQGTDATAQGNAEATAITADAVAMPSAEQLSATDGQTSAVEGGNAQNNAVVGQILADALNGGGDGPDLDALVSSFAGHGGHKDGATDKGPEGLASHGHDAVSNGDMGVFAAFHGAHGTDMIDLTMHQDAAPLNG